MIRFLFIVNLFFLFSCHNNNSVPNDTINGVLEESFPYPNFSNNTADQVSEAFPRIDSSYYETGELKQIINHQGVQEFVATDFYKSGGIKEIFEQGSAFGCGITVGIIKYDEQGVATREVMGDSWLNEGAEGCHELRQVMSIQDFYSNGNLKTSGHMESCYECEECPCGVWETYDEKGNLLITETFGDCYDSVLDCLTD